MIESFVNQLGNILEGNVWIWWVVISVFCAFYVFWRGVKYKCLDDDFALEHHLTSSYTRSLRLFDFLFMVLISTILIGRLMRIFSEVDFLVDSRWFWLPYEKIQNQVYIMEAFPWLFFNISVGGVLLEGVFLGLVSSLIVFSWIFNLKVVNFIEPISALVRILSINFLFFVYIESMDIRIAYLLIGVFIWIIVETIVYRLKSMEKYRKYFDIARILIAFVLLILSAYVFRSVWGYDGVNRQFADLLWLFGCIVTSFIVLVGVLKKFKLITKVKRGSNRLRIYKR